MIIIGELINSTRKPIRKAIEEQNAAYIQEIAVRQVKNGADFVDVNAGAFINDETRHLVWLVETVQEVVDKPLALDSPNPEALRAALKVHRGTAMINSITAEEARYARIVPLVKEYGALLVALCMGDAGMPAGTAERIEMAGKLLTMLDRDGVPLQNVFLDPLINPVSVNGEHGLQACEAIEKIAAMGSGAHITCGLSNISFGLPHRRLLNQAFLLIAMGKGLDSAIADPLDKEMMSLIRAAEVVLGKDAYAMRYLKASRAGMLS